jgi:protein-L-isoaspartate O-methyltransferase
MTPETGERAFLQQVRETYAKGSAQDRAIRGLAVRTFQPWLSSDTRALQLGYSEGVDTALLAQRVGRLDIVEGEPAFAADARTALPDSTVFESLFEDFTLPSDTPPYDAVFALYILEHVQSPVDVLLRAKTLLAPQGKLFVVVPNARALSRQLARHMGLLDELKALTPNDHNHGHRRVYDRVDLARDLRAAGFRVVAEGGLMLKLLADFQLDQLYEAGILGDAQVDGLYKLGLEYPDLCGSLFAVCDTEPEA